MNRVEAFAKAYLAAYKPYKSRWNYEDGCVLVAACDLYRATGDPVWRDFVLGYLSPRVMEDGSIPEFKTDSYSIDDINPGKALFFALEETGEERYRKAIEFHFRRLMEHPRCACGNFWHKEIYPNQVWLDGLYMAQPFYMEYEEKFDHNARIADITRQFAQAQSVLYNPDKGLSYHAWDESRTMFWADRETGLSPNFWLRAMGWYVMALIDSIEHCDRQLFEHYQTLVDIFRVSIRGLLRWQDEKTGLFYQVIDRADVPDNYLETSGSAMICYAVLKAVRLGVLDGEKYLPVSLRIWQGLEDGKLVTGEDGQTHLTDICRVAGLGGKAMRDGSVAYYLSEERCCDDAKGVGPFLMAWSEKLRVKE